MEKTFIKGSKCKIAPNFEFSGKVTIADEVIIEEDVKFLCDAINIEKGCVIGKGVHIQGGKFDIGKNTRIRPFARFHVTKTFKIGPDSKIGCNWNVSGRNIEIGQHLWCVDADFIGNGIIGGGSCFDVHSKLVIGDHCHLGMETYINTARPVTIGNNVGFGFRSMIFTHGAWQNVLEGYPVNFAPVTIEDDAWIPTNIIIMPGVRIGRGATIGSGSVVNRDVPALCLAGGVPAKIIRTAEEYPKRLTLEEKFALLRDILNTWKPFITDAGFELIESIENKKNIKIRLKKDQQVFSLICFKEKEKAPTFEADTRIVILTFDEEFYLDSADCILYLKSYSEIKKYPNEVAEHIKNFLRRRGIKFLKEKNINVEN